MTIPKRLMMVCMVIVGFWICHALSAEADTASFDIPLNAPKLQTLGATIPLGAETVSVVLGIQYDINGKAVLEPSSTVDGQLVTGKVTHSGTSDGFRFSFSVKNSGTPKINAIISGMGGQSDPVTAKCTYSGPKGKTTVLENAVDLSRVTPTVHVVLDLQIDSKGKITGTGTITGGYGVDLGPGLLKGTLKKGKVSWSLKQGKQQLSFNGTAAASSSWVGTLKVTIPPAKMTIASFPVSLNALPAAGEATFKGKASMASAYGVSAAQGVTVTFRSDLDKNGTLSSEESTSAQTDSDGNFERTLAVVPGSPVLVDFKLAGYVAATRVFSSVTQNSTVVVNATLQELKELKLSGGKAQSDDGKLIIENLPQGVVSIRGQTFNPVTETNQFPGAFADQNGSLLVSSVFSVIQAEDSSGSEVKTLNANSTLKMQVPEDTWSTLKDLLPGNGKIDVPLYYFDEFTGQWKRAINDGWLIDSSGNTISESALSSINQKNYTGPIYATGEISHLSYWNIDWPVDTHSCVSGRIVDGLGTPVQGAAVSIKGVTYTGTTSPQVTGEDGLFCADVMRSEAPGEDIDGNGAFGETHSVEIVVSRDGQYYKFGPYSIPIAQASCGSGGCLDLGNLPLSDDKKLQVTLCEINGKVLFSGVSALGKSPLNAGDPIEGATVFGMDSDAVDSLGSCVTEGTCTVFATTDADGAFHLRIPVLTSIQLSGMKWGASSDPHVFDVYTGQLSTHGCPSESVTIGADYYGGWNLVGEMTGVSEGYVMVWNGGASCYFSYNGDYYFGIAPSISPISGTGPWFTLDMQKSTTTGTGSAGQISFSVTSISADQRYSGFWSLGSLSGTWAE